MANEDDELISVYGEENVKDFRMWQTHAKMPGETLTPYEWAQLSVEDKINYVGLNTPVDTEYHGEAHDTRNEEKNDGSITTIPAPCYKGCTGI